MAGWAKSEIRHERWGKENGGRKGKGGRLLVFATMTSAVVTAPLRKDRARRRSSHRGTKSERSPRAHNSFRSDNRSLRSET